MPKGAGLLFVEEKVFARKMLLLLNRNAGEKRIDLEIGVCYIENRRIKGNERGYEVRLWISKRE